MGGRNGLSARWHYNLGGLVVKRWIIGLVALVVLVGVKQASAVILLDNFGDGTFFTSGLVTEQAVLTKIDVGSSNVDISGFGTWGSLIFDGQLKGLVFKGDPPADDSIPTFQTSPLAASNGGPQWHDTQTISYTLQANSTYYMGIVFDKHFNFYYENPSAANSANGLTSPASGFSGSSGLALGFDNPLFDHAFVNAQHSIRIFGPSTPPVPEPSTLAIWSLLGLCGIGIGWYRRRKT